MQWAKWHGGLGRPGSAGVECCPPPMLKKQITFAPWAYKDKKLVSLKISTNPSYIWSTDSKTVLR